ncbi:MAG: NTP transferase domain-containing protein [Planctomycetia bacterium]|nr:NTP transferase domain-containing protein [Planctomycetia bacterium]
MHHSLPQSSKVVAYIPARLGSVRVAAKNLRLLAGRPLVTYVAHTALQAATLDQVYVNTESRDIAAAVAPTGVRVYRRDPALAIDSTSTDEILYDFAKAVDCETIVVINPTAPFLRAETIDQAVRAYRSNPHGTLFSTTAMRRHLVFDRAPLNFAAEGKSPRTQDLKPFEFINFIIFITAREQVISKYEQHGYCLYSPPLSFFHMSGIECHDIDDEDDFRMAEALLASGVVDRRRLA